MTMDLPPSPHQVIGPPPQQQDTPCPFIVVLGGRECGCPIRGGHTVHRYRSPAGIRHQFELVDLDG